MCPLFGGFTEREQPLQNCWSQCVLYSEVPLSISTSHFEILQKELLKLHAGIDVAGATWLG